jgi:hypothetical protein
MRITLFMLVLMLIGALFLWAIFSGALLWGLMSAYLLFIVLTFSYSDIAILFFLGAREIRSGHGHKLYEAAAQSAYKLAVRAPKLYFYNGSLDRAFVLQNGERISLVLNKDLIDSSQASELAAICFELLLQVKKGMASKRTKVMYMLGLVSWVAHALTGLLLTLIPFKEVRRCCDVALSYVLYPWLDMLFSLTLGRGFFRKIAQHLADYPAERELLNRVGLKLRRTDDIYSLPTKKMLQISSVTRSRHYQNILALEVLPHEWDFIFAKEEIEGAKPV